MGAVEMRVRKSDASELLVQLLFQVDVPFNLLIYHLAF